MEKPPSGAARTRRSPGGAGGDGGMGGWGDGGMGHGMGGWGVVSSRAWSPQWKYVNDCKCKRERLHDPSRACGANEVEKWIFRWSDCVRLRLGEALPHSQASKG